MFSKIAAIASGLEIEFLSSIIFREFFTFVKVLGSIRQATGVLFFLQNLSI